MSESVAQGIPLIFDKLYLDSPFSFNNSFIVIFITTASISDFRYIINGISSFIKKSF